MQVKFFNFNQGMEDLIIIDSAFRIQEYNKDHLRVSIEILAGDSPTESLLREFQWRVSVILINLLVHDISLMASLPDPRGIILVGIAFCRNLYYP